jgi:hypothetical protein
MMEAGYSAERLARVRRDAILEAQHRPAKSAMQGGDGVLVRRIPKEAYFNAVVNHGEDPKDEGYWRDMERLYPECRVAYTPSKVIVPLGTQGAGTRGLPKLTRFGRVTFHKRYATAARTR